MRLGAVQRPANLARWRTGEVRSRTRKWTLGAQQAVEAARLLHDALVVPVHSEGWAHLSQSPDDVSAAFEAAGLTYRLRVPAPGAPLALP